MAHDAHMHAKAQALWEAGLSANAIAEQLGSVGKDSIIRWSKEDNWPENGRNKKKYAEIEEQSLVDAAKSVGIDKQWWFKKQAEIAGMDLADLYHIEEGGELSLKTFDEMNASHPNASKLIKKIKEKRRIQEGNDGSQAILNQELEVELLDKQKALSDIASALGWKQEKVDMKLEQKSSLEEMKRIAKGEDAHSE